MKKLVKIIEIYMHMIYNFTIQISPQFTFGFSAFGYDPQEPYAYSIEPDLTAGVEYNYRTEWPVK